MRDVVNRDDFDVPPEILTEYIYGRFLHPREVLG